MDIYTTVVKILGESFSDRNAVKRRLNWLRNYFRQERLSRALDVVLPGGAFAMKLTGNDWHLLLLFHRRSLVLGLNCLVRLTVSRYGLDKPSLAIMVGQHCDRCSFQVVVCEMWLYACSLSRLSHNVVERSCTKRCASKPDELLALTISWSLKYSIWRWIEMVQVLVLERFYWTTFRSQDGPGKIYSHLIHLQHLRGRPNEFWSRKRTRLTSVQFEVFNTLWCFSQRKHCGCQLSLVFTSPSSKKEAKVEPSRPL